MVKILSQDEILKMRVEINNRTNPVVKPPDGREYWDVERIVATLEYFQQSVQSDVEVCPLESDHDTLAYNHHKFCNQCGKRLQHRVRIDPPSVDECGCDACERDRFNIKNLKA